MKTLSDVLKIGDVIVADDNGWEGSHLAMFLGKDFKMVMLIWLDGKAGRCQVFKKDFDGGRFVPIKLDKCTFDFGGNDVSITWKKRRLKYVVSKM